LPTANRIFAPAPEEVDWARVVVQAYEAASAEGRGALSVNGKMVDAANVRMAQTILRRQQAIEAREQH
jgi:citrate lyase beta subunit